MPEQSRQSLLAIIAFFTVLPLCSIGQELLSVALQDSISGRGNGETQLWQPSSWVYEFDHWELRYQHYEWDQSDLTSAISRLLHHQAMIHGDTTICQKNIDYQKARETNTDYFNITQMSHDIICTKGILHLDLLENNTITFKSQMPSISQTSSLLSVSIAGETILEYHEYENWAKQESFLTEEPKTAGLADNSSFSFEDFRDSFESVMSEHSAKNQANGNREPCRSVNTGPYSVGSSGNLEIYRHAETIHEYCTDNGFGYLELLKKLDIPMRHLFKGGHFVWFEDIE